MTDTAKGYLRYGVFALLAFLVFGVSIYGGYQASLNWTQRVADEVEDRPMLETVDEPKPMELVSEDTQVVNVESEPGIYFQYAFDLTDEIWFSDLTFKEVVVVEPPNGSDETVMVIDYNGKKVSLPLVGTVALKIGEGEGSYAPAKVRDLGNTIAPGTKLMVGATFVPSEVTASADEIQAKLTEGLDSAAEMNDLFLLNIAKRGVKKLTQEEIVQRLQQGGQVSFEAQEMMVNTIEVRQP